MYSVARREYCKMYGIMYTGGYWLLKLQSNAYNRASKQQHLGGSQPSLHLLRTPPKAHTTAESHRFLARVVENAYTYMPQRVISPKHSSANRSRLLADIAASTIADQQLDDQDV